MMPGERLGIEVFRVLYPLTLALPLPPLVPADTWHTNSLLLPQSPERFMDVSQVRTVLLAVATDRVDTADESQGSGFEMLYESTLAAPAAWDAYKLDLTFAITRSAYTVQVRLIKQLVLSAVSLAPFVSRWFEARTHARFCVHCQPAGRQQLLPHNENIRIHHIAPTRLH